jgi:hypothetical protein
MELAGNFFCKFFVFSKRKRLLDVDFFFKQEARFKKDIALLLPSNTFLFLDENWLQLGHLKP